MEKIVNRRVEIGSLSNKELVDKINQEIATASEAARLTHLFAEASIAEAEGRLTIEEGRYFYGNMALAASNMAQEDMREGKEFFTLLNIASQVKANSALRVSIAASERMIRGLENQTPNRT